MVSAVKTRHRATITQRGAPRLGSCPPRTPGVLKGGGKPLLEATLHRSGGTENQSCLAGPTVFVLSRHPIIVGFTPREVDCFSWIFVYFVWMTDI